MDAGVHARIGDDRRRHLSGPARTVIVSATASAKAKARRRVPRWERRETRAARPGASSGTPAAAGSGRPLRIDSLATRFTAAELIARAATPVRAARLPVRPRPSPSCAAIPNQSLDRLATSERRRSGSSSVGVGVAVDRAIDREVETPRLVQHLGDRRPRRLACLEPPGESLGGRSGTRPVDRQIAHSLTPCFPRATSQTARAAERGIMAFRAGDSPIAWRGSRTRSAS